MGQAKLRRLLNPESYGKPALFILQFKEDGENICQVPYTLKKRSHPHETRQAAEAIALQIVGFVVNPDDESHRFAAWVALEHPDSAAGRRGDWGKLLPLYCASASDSTSFQLLTELCDILPPVWTARILDEEGNELRDSAGGGIELSNVGEVEERIKTVDFLVKAIA